jgi:hypothetical protein
VSPGVEEIARPIEHEDRRIAALKDENPVR